MYRPLPSCVTVKHSDIDGLGLFAIEDIPNGTEIGMSHFFWGEQLQRTPLGAFYNHSEDPNLKKYQVDSRFFLKAIKDIKAGDELTCTYTFYSIEAS